uniref:C-CAP/cofactor C-like domain-containing protein n=1 Tax=Parastrongyloides trichosuri TaxID=131310 RepID=A0A0N4ZF63_PARTI
MKSICCINCFGNHPSIDDDEYTKNDNQQQTFSWDLKQSNPENYIVRNLQNEFVHKKGGDIDGQQFVIENCHNCTIVENDFSGSVTIDDSQDCVIIIGPCKGSVFIRDCQRCQIFLACQQFRTRDCNDLSIFILCPTQPIIEQSTRIRFSPLSINYDGLENQLNLSGLSPFKNKWNKVHDFTPAERGTNFGIKEEYDYSGFGDKLIQINKNTGISFEISDSYFPTVTMNGNESKISLILTQNKNDNLFDFYQKAFKTLKAIESPQPKLSNIIDMNISKGELKVLPSKYVKFKDMVGQLLLFELLNISIKDIEEKIGKPEKSNNFYIFNGSEYIPFIKHLYQLADIKSNI